MYNAEHDENNETLQDWQSSIDDIIGNVANNVANGGLVLDAADFVNE